MTYAGLAVGKIVTKPVTGKLILCDSNTNVKGVMRIEGDGQRMMFLPSGKIYCHPQHGKLLTKVKRVTTK